MKFEYETPEIEFITLELRDIITTSDITTTDDNEGEILTKPTDPTGSTDDNEGEILTTEPDSSGGGGGGNGNEGEVLTTHGDDSLDPADSVDLADVADPDYGGDEVPILE